MVKTDCTMERETRIINGKQLEVVKIDEAWMRENYELFRQEYFSDIDMPTAEEMHFLTNLGKYSRRRWWGWAQVEGLRWQKMRGTETRYNPQIERGINSLKPGTMGFPTGSLQDRFIKRNLRSWVTGETKYGPYSEEYGKDGKYTIAVDSTDWMPELLFEGVLVHEMVHIACFKNRLWQGGMESHDGWFRQIGEYVTQKSGGRYNIERYVTKEESATRTEIRMSDNGTDDAAVVCFSLSEDIETVGTRLWESTGVLWYWLPSRDEAKAFAAKALQNPGYLDFGRRKHLYPFYSNRRQCKSKIAKATVFDCGTKHLVHNKTAWVEWLVKRCIKATADGGPSSVITDNLIKIWGTNLDPRSGRCALNKLWNEGVISNKEVVGNPAPQSPYIRQDGMEATAPKAADKPESTESPEPPKEETPEFRCGEDPREYLSKLRPEQRRAFYELFFDWYKGQGEYSEGGEKGSASYQNQFTKQEVEEWGSRNLPGRPEQDVLMSYVLWTMPQSKWLDAPSEVAAAESWDLNLTDEQRMAVITESMLGRFFGKAYETAKDWLSSLVDRVKASLWDDTVKVEKNEDGTMTVTVT